MEEFFKYLDLIVAKLLTLDSPKLVVVMAIALGYILKLIQTFPNRLIPLACCSVTVLFYPLMVWTGWDVRKVTTDVAVAIILFLISWGLHRFILRPLIDKRIFDEQDADDKAPNSNNNDQPKQ